METIATDGNPHLCWSGNPASGFLVGRVFPAGHPEAAYVQLLQLSAGAGEPSLFGVGAGATPMRGELEVTEVRWLTRTVDSQTQIAVIVTASPDVEAVNVTLHRLVEGPAL